MDYNAAAIDRQYRSQEGIVSIEDIRNLMDVYRLGKAPISLALGFGEITITRYLSGQIPSKEYSNIIRKALESITYMQKRLQKNREKIGEAAYKKAMGATQELQPLFGLSEKMLLTISCIFKKAEEITPLALEKMLYYIQGIHMVLYGTELYPEDCQAWAHGPVYKDVYDVFKNFKYNPIDDTRFAMFQNRFSELTENEKRVIDLVIESFGMYSGKTLERITHAETPWKEARADCLPEERSHEVITKTAIKDYFTKLSKRYDIGTPEGIRTYIGDMLLVG